MEIIFNTGKCILSVQLLKIYVYIFVSIQIDHPKSYYAANKKSVTILKDNINKVMILRWFKNFSAVPVCIYIYIYEEGCNLR